MSYSVLFPTEKHEKRFEKDLHKIPQKKIREKIMTEVESLASNHKPQGKKFKTLAPPIALGMMTAQYRLRIGDFRILYDIDERERIVWIFELRKRSNGTYR
jgi:mRNA-degrading endonuclease RelE of RelBE toxin-antitoxin system